jgi:transglutaminase-like putative cysteine protease
VLRTFLLAAAAGLVIAVDWLRFEEAGANADGRAFVLVLLAIAPAVLPPVWPRIAGVLVSLLLGAWVAFSVSPLALWPGGENFFGTLGARFGDGFVDFYEFRLPFDPVRHPESHQVLLAAVFGFTFATALAIAARRPVPAVLCFLVGAGWPATVLAGGNELGRGAVILAVALGLLAGLTERPSRFAVVATGIVVGGALALSSSAAVAKPAFLAWEQWDFYTRAQKPVSVRFIWDAQYGGVRFPEKATTVLTIRAPRRPQYWRATVLSRFDGTRWLERVWRETERQRLLLNAAGARDERRWIAQEVEVEALDDDHLIGATNPVAFEADEPAVYEGQGVARVPGGLDRNESYRVWSFIARPSPERLVRVRARYPTALTRPGRELDLAPGVTAPPFGAAGREARVLQLLRGRLEPYVELYELARTVGGQTRSPYAATIALETWFRTTGGFTYSEQPGATPGLPPLVGFVADTRTGYCQQFAGGMAVMLRALGIPARVAVGFVPGRYRDGEWTVTDHDAHAWVEVWFRGYGWLPFDPTPGRGRLSGPHSSTSLGFDPQATARLFAGFLTGGGELFGRGTRAALEDRRGLPDSGRDFPEFGTPTAEGRRAPSLLLFVVLLAAGVAAAVVALKLLRRKARYLTRDPRRIAVACTRELAEFVHDQRLPAAPAATFHELGATITERLGIDTSGFTAAATEARYGPPGEARRASRRARRELRQLKRRLRDSLDVADRTRGLVSVRSLGLG